MEVRPTLGSQVQDHRAGNPNSKGLRSLEVEHLRVVQVDPWEGSFGGESSGSSCQEIDLFLVIWGGHQNVRVRRKQTVDQAIM